jgi:hypothetical protein
VTADEGIIQKLPVTDAIAILQGKPSSGARRGMLILQQPGLTLASLILHVPTISSPHGVWAGLLILLLARGYENKLFSCYFQSYLDKPRATLAGLIEAPQERTGVAANASM